MKGSPRIPLFVALLLLLTAAGDSEEDPAVRVGVLFWHDSPNDIQALAGVREGFRLAGIEARFDIKDANRDEARARKVLEEWEAAEYDLVYAMGTSAARHARSVIRKLPVVFTAVTHPVGSEVVRSWDGSGGRLCGNSNWIARSDVFRVFQQAVPDLAVLGVVLCRTNPVSIEELAEARSFFRENPGRRLKLVEELIDGPEDLAAAAKNLVAAGVQAVWIPIDNDVYSHLDAIAAITEPKKIPLLSSQYSAVEEHRAIVGVAVDYHLLGMKSVVLAKRVLVDRADPGKLPIGRMRSFRVIVSLAAARRIDYRLPLPLLARADTVLDAPPEDR